VLLPEVRAAAKDTLIVTNGYSCREQIAQCTDRKALHLADVLRMAVRHEQAAVSKPLHHHPEPKEEALEID
jgi:hypothetical protein